MIATESVSLFAPPVPVLPWSLLVISIEPALVPEGVKLMPLRTALIVPMSPVKVMVVSAVPSPVLKVTLEGSLRVIVPLVAVRVTSMSSVPASKSETKIWLPLLLLKIRSVPTLVV